MPPLARLTLILYSFGVAYILFSVMAGNDNTAVKFVSWNEFVHEMLAKGEVS